MLTQLRKKIAGAARKARRERRLTQREVAQLLGLSQSRYSEIENSKGSFSAEQLIVLMRRFNLSIDYFVGEDLGRDREGELQNILSRLGAGGLYEDLDILTSEKLSNVNDVIIETISSADTARQVVALAPVIINHVRRINFRKIRNNLYQLGLEQRLGWLVESCLEAIKKELNKILTREQTLLYRRAEVNLFETISILNRFWDRRGQETPEDVLDRNISSKKSVDEVKKRRTGLANKWKIVTRITTDDFIKSMRESRT